MEKKQIRRNVGQYIRKLRLEHRMSLNEVVAYLSYYRIDCSKSNLNRIEIEDSPIRSDILAGLGLIFDTSTDNIVYRSSKKAKAETKVS